VRYLILGGKGFIGSVLREFIEADIVDQGDSVTKSYDVVFDLAAYHSVTESVKNPEMYIQNNTYWPGKVEADHYVFASSAAVYGEGAGPINPYGVSKAMAERLVQQYSKYTVFRLFNVAGGTEKVKDHNRRLIPIFKRESNPVIYGNDYPTPDGTAIRTYVHVVDVCKALLKKPQGTYDLGFHVASNKHIADLCGVNPEYAPARPGEPARLIGGNYMVDSPFTLEEIVRDS
jgi:UDP-glucose 4-epimerase